MPENSTDLRDKPAWVKDAIFYQIFPDRFARGESATKPSNLLSWSSPPSAEGYHGGDLWGVVEHLDHLVDLGVNALYLTPIFQSACNHRYHTHDYEKVDPLLGGNEALRALVRAAHDRRIRVVLDGVFNHASRGFFQFNDILENGPHSPWLDWFHVEGWPLSAYDGAKAANYRSWVDNRALPKLNTDNPAVREFLMRIGEFWIREFDIDGWRLDVPEEIKTEGFWEEFRRRTRAVRPDVYLVGEIWRAAPQWLDGDRFDATMNYPFAAATIAFAAGDRVSRALVEDRSYEPYPGIDAAEFGRRIAALLEEYDWPTTQVQLNLLGSHDAPRLLSIARGDKASLRLATLFQMTYPGAPCIYYGDEIGLRGAKRYDRPHRDQDARWPFPWNERPAWDEELLKFFQAAVSLRRQHAALRGGAFDQVYAEGRQFAFLRHDENEALLVVLNADDQDAKIDLRLPSRWSRGTTLAPVFGSVIAGPCRTGSCSLQVPARAGTVLVIES